MHTVESKFSNFLIEYLGELETEFDNTLACAVCRGPRWVRIMKIKNHGGRKSHDTLPLSLTSYGISLNLEKQRITT